MNQSGNWIERGLDAVVKTYGRYPLVAASGQGCWLTDIDGRRYLDFLAGVAVNNLGHCHPAVVAALQEQAAKLIHCSNFYHIPSQIELAELLCENSFAEQVFFCNSGAEANETAIKLARRHSSTNYHKERIEIISTQDSFHGRTLGTLSATGQEKIQTGFAPLLPGFRYVPFGDIKALEQAIGAQTCAVLLEPIQGEGGVRLPPNGYLQAVRDLCDRHELLLMLDEIQVGMGRTGSLFAYQQEGIEPDVMTLAKALAGGAPIGAMLTHRELAKALGPGSHGSTFGGNPLVTAAGVATLQTLLQGDILANCRAMGDYLCNGLESLRQRYPVIREVRGRGLMIGLELDCDGSNVVNAALAKGLLINCTMGKVLRFVPPLIVNRSEIDQMLAILEDIFMDLASGG